MPDEIWVADSHAKINLGLHVLERLPTGYHEIETGFCFLEWNDRLTVVPANEMSLDMGDSDIPVDRSNLINKAVTALSTYAGLERSYRIEVEKHIPAGAGLGGGSSNAATILRMLNKIEDLGLSTKDLIDLSRNLGADIAFFLQGEPAVGSGVGAELEPADIQPDHWVVTIFPGIHSSTAEAYAHCQPNPDHEFGIKRVLTEMEIDEWQYLLINDLEPAVMQLHPMVGDLKDQLYEFGATYAAMSGSGSAVYGIFEQDFVALNAYNSFLDLDFATNITRPKFRPDYGIYRKD